MTRRVITVGVLALQGAFIEHIKLLQQAAVELRTVKQTSSESAPGDPLNGTDEAVAELTLDFVEVRTPAQLASCDALILPGGESTSISLIAERTGLLEPLREFVKIRRKPVWGTCAGLILLAESANKSKSTGQELIGGLDVRVHRNYFGRQVESFEADLDLPFLADGRPFHSVFIRAPVVEEVISHTTDGATTPDGQVTAPPRQATQAQVEVLGRLPGRAKTLKDQTVTAEDLGEDGDIVAVKQGNCFATAFHPELTGDARIHTWWLRHVLNHVAKSG